MKYELPEAVKNEYIHLYEEAQKLRDGINRMKRAGLDTTALELKLEDAEKKLQKILDAFEITIPEKR